MLFNHKSLFILKSFPLLYAEYPVTEARRQAVEQTAREESARLEQEGWSIDKNWGHYDCVRNGVQLILHKHDIECEDIPRLWGTKIFGQGFQKVKFEIKGETWSPDEFGKHGNSCIRFRRLISHWRTVRLVWFLEHSSDSTTVFCKEQYSELGEALWEQDTANAFMAVVHMVEAKVALTKIISGWTPWDRTDPTPVRDDARRKLFSIGSEPYPFSPEEYASVRRWD